MPDEKLKEITILLFGFALGLAFYQEINERIIYPKCFNHSAAGASSNGHNQQAH